MSELRLYLREKVPHVHTENSIAIIRAYNEYNRSIKGRYCGICYKVFTKEEERLATLYASPMHFYDRLCKEHLPHGEKPNRELVCKELGIEQEAEENRKKLFEVY